MKTHHRKVPRYRLEVNLRRKDSLAPWKWEIYADGDRLFVAQSDSGYAARADAVAAGERELQRWLDAARTGSGRPSRTRPADSPAAATEPAEYQPDVDASPHKAAAAAIPAGRGDSDDTGSPSLLPDAGRAG